MQEINQSPIIKDVSRFSWLSSLSILTLTLSVIAWLYVYQYFTSVTIEELNTDISQLENSILTASNDKDVIIANILSSTTIRPSVNLKSLVNSFRLAAAGAGVRLNGFSVHDDTISTTLIATQESITKDPIETIIAMMRSDNMRSGLSLEPISAVQWNSSERTTAVSFRILSSNSTTNAAK